MTPWTAARQASLSFTTSRSLLKFVSIESVRPSSHLVLCRLFLFLPSIFPSIRVFSSESAPRIRWSKPSGGKLVFPTEGSPSLFPTWNHSASSSTRPLMRGEKVSPAVKLRDTGPPASLASSQPLRLNQKVGGKWLWESVGVWQPGVASVHQPRPPH